MPISKYAANVTFINSAHLHARTHQLRAYQAVNHPLKKKAYSTKRRLYHLFHSFKNQIIRQ